METVEFLSVSKPEYESEFDSILVASSEEVEMKLTSLINSNPFSLNRS